MIIIAFCIRTSKLLPRIFCRHFKHCAPIIINDDGQLIMYQFIRYGHFAKIPLRIRDLNILRQHGWHFIYMSGISLANININARAISCVQFTCRVANINHTVFTPDGLYKKLTGI